ncbi:MAG: tetratricopeptide repeat protein [Syntrophobacteraceae bacterium]
MERNPIDIHIRVQAFTLEGNRLLAAGDAEGAAECFRKGLGLIRGFSRALLHLAALLKQYGEPEDAEKFATLAASLFHENSAIPATPDPPHEQPPILAEAAAECLAALRLEPGSPAVWTNLGVHLARAKREEEAEQCYRTAIELDDDFSNAYFNLSYLLLRRGEFEEGLHCRESRKSHGHLDNYFTFPRWNGEPLQGKSVIIGFEGGHGDMIHFCRYASVLKAMGAGRISIACHPGLKTLFETLSGCDEALFFPEEVPTDGWDFWTLAMSLPYLCKTRLHNIPAPIPYLEADPARVAKWSQRLPPSGLKIGLVWRGNPKFENDNHRSLPSLDVLAPLAALPGAHFVSLQKGQGEEEAKLPPAGLRLLALGTDLRDFADTAALMASLDLVISVDTAAAHLAGAMGKPCWVLLPDHLPDWRWLTGRTDSPWYPKGMRLFRQPPGGSWDEVVASVREALQLFMEEP